jgi:hypothetical protein
MRDLGLSYDEAAHGVQSAIRYEMTQRGFGDSGTVVDMVKHLRTGIDMRAADAGGLAGLLIAKGIFTADEYMEHMRLAANEELARYQDHCRKVYGLPDTVDFR